MKLYEASFETILLRYYLMMALVIVGMYSGIYALSFAAIPVFLSALMGFKIKSKNTNSQSRESRLLDSNQNQLKQVA